MLIEKIYIYSLQRADITLLKEIKLKPSATQIYISKIIILQ